MAGSVNKVILVGNLGADPEIRRLNSGDRSSTCASPPRKAGATEFRRAQGKDRVAPVVIFNENIAKVAEQYLKKGVKVYVEGQLQTRKWPDQSGAEKYSTEIVLQKFRGELTMLDGRGQGEGGQVGGYPAAAAAVGSDFGQSGPNEDSGRGGGAPGRGGGGRFVARAGRRDPIQCAVVAAL